MLSMWRDRNYGTPSLLLWTLFCKSLGFDRQIPYPCPIPSLWWIHPSSGPHSFRNSLQQTSSIYTTTCTDATTRKVLILLLQEIKRDIIYRRAQLQEPRRREELHPRIQAHLVSVINKITSLLEYQGTLQFRDGLSFLKRLSQIILQAWNSSLHLITHQSFSIPLPLSSHIQPPHCVGLVDIKNKNQKKTTIIKPV